MELARGESLAVVGRSGSGKTTLARCIAGLAAPTKGAISVDGQPLPRHATHRTHEQLARIQYVFQDARSSFVEYWPVNEQIERPARRLLRLDERTARRRATAAVEQVGLDPETTRRRPHGLSGGELQRAALARALTVAPSVLLCDEITTGLDTETQAQVLDLLDDLRRATGLALLVISHDAAVVTRLCDRVLTIGVR
ncbi:MAG: ATP-binding cassette domain-containing protein [Streptosporangiales bacterium]|nr:ATP-binding cassette domain-containing protein [Streptosporangiales bacterium]